MLKLLRNNWFPVVIFIAAGMAVLHETAQEPAASSNTVTETIAAKVPVTWQAPGINSLGNDSAAQLIRYGKELIAHTAQYLGPKGSVAAITNGMNCQNCHIDAGARPYGNCLSAVAATYPVFRPRSGRVESIEFRINDCLQRSLNGKSIDSLRKEMRAMVAYIKWLGAATPRGTRPPGAGTRELALMAKAADKNKGKSVFQQQCSRCHGANGEGQLQFDGTVYTYPPLWGTNSYNIGAGLYRISKLAAYAKDNMPFDKASPANPVLSDEEAWDVAAFINSQPRPLKDLRKDWPKITDKAFDYPFGPYADTFTEIQHKYGPFEPIKKAQQLLAGKK